MNKGIAARVLAVFLAISGAGVAFIAQHEGTRYEAYLDSAGIPTICTGHIKGVKLGQVATEAECEHYLREDLAEAEAAVKACTHRPITQEQYDVLVSFTFNVGGGAFCNSTLARKLNRDDCRNAANEFLKWDKVTAHKKKRVVKGLSNRREDEREVFLQGCV